MMNIHLTTRKGNQSISYGDALGFVMSLQLIGFGMAGILRRFLVKPAAMYWPSTLSSVALFVGFHETSVSSGSWTRYQFFWIACGAMFVYSWIPEYFITVLQSVSWLCFLSKSSDLNFLASGSRLRGVGLGTLTFDWFYITGTSLTSPFNASLQIFLGNILWLWILTPILYFSNAFDALKLKLPHDQSGYTINSNLLYSNNGSVIDPADLLNKKTFDLDQEAYSKVQPIYMSSLFTGTRHFLISKSHISDIHSRIPHNCIGIFICRLVVWKRYPTAV